RYVLGCPPGRFGICTGSFPLGWIRADRTPAMTGPPPSPGTNARTTRAARALAVAPVAGRPVPEQAGEVADDGHAEVGLAGRGQRGPEAGPVLSLHRTDLDVGGIDALPLSPP